MLDSLSPQFIIRISHSMFNENMIITTFMSGNFMIDMTWVLN